MHEEQAWMALVVGVAQKAQGLALSLAHLTWRMSSFAPRPRICYCPLGSRAEQPASSIRNRRKPGLGKVLALTLMRLQQIWGRSGVRTLSPPRSRSLSRSRSPAAN